MLLPPDLARFIAWFAAFQGRIGAQVGSIMHLPTDVDLAAKSEQATDVVWGNWLDASAQPTLRGMHMRVSDSLTLVTSARPFTALAEELRQAIQLVPDATALGMGGDDDGGYEEVQQSTDVPLRQWLEVRFATDALPAFAELDNTLELALRDMARKIEGVEGVLDYYTLAVQRHAAALEEAQAEEFARTGLARVQNLIHGLHRLRAISARRALGAFMDRTAGALEEASAPYRSHQGQVIRRTLEEHARLSMLAPVKPSMIRRAWREGERGYRAARPVVRQLASEVRAVFAEQAPEPTHDGAHALLLRHPTELGNELPLSYRRLFTAVPLDNAEFYVRRPAQEEAFTRAIEEWRAGAPQSILLHGDGGAGKRTLTNHVLARVRSQALLDVRWIRLGPNLCEEAAVANVLARALDVASAPTRLADLREDGAGGARRRVIVLENAQRLLAPTPAGVTRMSDLLAVVGDTAATTLWVLLMATPAATFALHRLGFANRIPTIVHVEPMSAPDLRGVIVARHRLSGFGLVFADPGMHLVDLLSHPLSSVGGRAPSDTFYGRLWTLAGGNPRQAMYYWLAHARRHLQQEGQIVVDPLPARAFELLPALPLSQRLVLALLAQHDSLDKDDLVAALSLPSHSIDGDLRVLCARKYVTPSSELDRHWTLRRTLAHPLILELRSLNMI